MTVTVEYFAQARVLAGTASEQVPLGADSSFRELLHELSRRHSSLAPILFRDGEPSRTTLFSISDVQIRPGENPVLQDGDRVTIVPPISGGQA